MRNFLLAAAALCLGAGAALAEPVVLTKDQLDRVTGAGVVLTDRLASGLILPGRARTILGGRAADRAGVVLTDRAAGRFPVVVDD